MGLTEQDALPWQKGTFDTHFNIIYKYLLLSEVFYWHEFIMRLLWWSYLLVVEKDGQSGLKCS